MPGFNVQECEEQLVLLRQQESNLKEELRGHQDKKQKTEKQLQSAVRKEQTLSNSTEKRRQLAKKHDSDLIQNGIWENDQQVG